MIPLSLGEVIAAYTITGVALLLALALLGGLWRARRDRRSRRRLIQCALCGVIYEDPSAEPLPRCPGCGHPNERVAPPGP